MTASDAKMILAGDIGGTKTRLALYRREGDELASERVETYSSCEVREFPNLLKRFLKDHSGPIESACFGAPGPVFEGEVEPTNLEWKVTEEDIRQALEIHAVKLVNDLVATAAAIPHLAPEQVVTLQEASSARQAREQRCVVLAPGTGLGQAYLAIRDGEPRLFPSEGGHTDLAPTNALEVDLCHFLRARHQRVTWEDALSGPGIENIYAFLLESKYRRVPEALAERLAADDRAKVISEAGLRGEADICVETMDIFVSLLGSLAGNVALGFRANGGVYLGGGIPPKILPALQKGAAVQAFLDKPSMAGLMKRFPLRVIMDDHAAIMGAARIASRLAVGAES